MTAQLGHRRVVRINMQNRVYVKHNGRRFYDSEKERDKRWPVNGRVCAKLLTGGRYRNILKVWCLIENRYLNMGYSHDDA